MILYSFTAECFYGRFKGVERKFLSDMVIGYHRHKIGIIGRTEMTKKCQETNILVLG